MTTEIEMDDLKARKEAQNAAVEAAGAPDTPKYRGGRLNQDADQEQAVALWSYVSTALYVAISVRRCVECADLPRHRLLTLAIPMVLFPQLLLYISETGFERRNALTPLESFLALHSGILLVAFALALLFNVSGPPRLVHAVA